MNRQRPVVKSPWSRVPYPGTAAADQLRDKFIADLMVIMGDTRLLWLPKLTDTTTATESSRNADVITWDATVASRLSALGSGVAQDFNGTDGEGDTPDSDIHSFGDGARDRPFGVVVLCKPDVNESAFVFAKENSTSIEEWRVDFNGSGHPQLVLTDESATATIRIRYATIIGTDWVLLSCTSDGSRSSAGLNIYTDGVRRAVTVEDAGSYIAMENTAALVHIGAHYTTKAGFFNGKIALAAVCAKELSAEDNWAIKALVNAYFQLSL